MVQTIKNPGPSLHAAPATDPPDNYTSMLCVVLAGQVTRHVNVTTVPG